MCPAPPWRSSPLVYALHDVGPCHLVRPRVGDQDRHMSGPRPSTTVNPSPWVLVTCIDTAEVADRIAGDPPRRLRST